MANYVEVVDSPSTDFLARNVILKHDGRAVLLAVAELLVLDGHRQCMLSSTTNWYQM